jgi:hypothetical protein
VSGFVKRCRSLASNLNEDNPLPPLAGADAFIRNGGNIWLNEEEEEEEDRG